MALVEAITPFAETQPCRPRVGVISPADVAIDGGDRLPPFDETSRGRTRDHRHASDFVFRKTWTEQEGAAVPRPSEHLGASSRKACLDLSPARRVAERSRPISL